MNTDYIPDGETHPKNKKFAELDSIQKAGCISARCLWIECTINTPLDIHLLCSNNDRCNTSQASEEITDFIKNKSVNDLNLMGEDKYKEAINSVYALSYTDMKTPFKDVPDESITLFTAYEYIYRTKSIDEYEHSLQIDHVSYKVNDAAFQALKKQALELISKGASSSYVKLYLALTQIDEVKDHKLIINPLIELLNKKKDKALLAEVTLDDLKYVNAVIRSVLGAHRSTVMGILHALFPEWNIFKTKSLLESEKILGSKQIIEIDDTTNTSTPGMSM